MRIVVNNKSLLVGVCLIIALVLANITATADEPFARKIELPKNLQNKGMWENLIKQWKIPSKSEVGIPAYPGSFIVALASASEMTLNGSKISAFPSLTLATTDGPDKVSSFYKEKLKDWKWKNSMGMFDIFWIGRDDFNNMDMTESMTTPNVLIMEAISAQTDFLPGAKTAITIVYKPGK